MQTSDYISLIGSIATAASVVWAIFVYLKADRSRKFANFRATIGALGQKVSELDGKLSEPQFAVIGHEISSALKNSVSNKWGLEDLKSFICKEESHSHLAQVIHMGRIRSGLPQEVLTLCSQLKQAPAVFKEDFPLLSKTLDCYLFYIVRTASGAISPRAFDAILGKTDVVKKHFIPEVKDDYTIEEFYTELAYYLSAAPKSMMSIGQKVFDESEISIQIIVSTFSRMSDANLKTASRIQDKNKKILSLPPDTSSAQDAIALLQPMRKFFEERDWDKLISSKTKIHELAHSKPEIEQDD